MAVAAPTSFWGALTSPQRAGLLAGVALIVALSTGVGVWALRDTYVPLATQLGPGRILALGQQLDAQKIPSRVSPAGDTIEVPQTLLSKARAAAAISDAGAGGNVGLEIFADADFSMTEFAQKVNYQRALQGELARTIQGLNGVRSARVHIVLADTGVLRRSGTKASAAVFLSTTDGLPPSAAQVRGIQRLVAAAVPEISPSAVTILGETGSSLSKNAASGEAMDQDQIALKRDVDEYLRQKLAHLLQDIAPQSHVTVTVDATLDMKQSRTVTEQPIAAPQRDPETPPAGVLTKERQQQRSTPAAQGSTASTDGGDSTSEYEYRVGNRSEQSVSMPGAITRLSVAVAVRGAPPEVTAATLEHLVTNAIGLDKARGDTASVLLLPLRQTDMRISAVDRAMASPVPEPSLPLEAPQPSPVEWDSKITYAAMALIALLGLSLAIFRLQQHRASARRVQEVTAQVHRWLEEP